MLIGLLLLTALTVVNSRKIKVSANKNSLENLLWELVSAYENRIQNEATHSHPSKVIRRRNISLPEENHSVKYSFSIRGPLDNLKSPIVHVYRTKKKKDPYNRTENIRYKMLVRKTNEEFLSYLDKMIEAKTQSLHEAEEKIIEIKRKIGKYRSSNEHPMTRPAAAEAELLNKLVKKENLLRFQLAEKLNKYLTTATSLVLPFAPSQSTNHDQMNSVIFPNPVLPQSNVVQQIPLLPNSAVIPILPFNPGALGRIRRNTRRRARPSPRGIFLSENEMREINRLIRYDRDTERFMDELQKSNHFTDKIERRSPLTQSGRIHRSSKMKPSLIPAMRRLPYFPYM